MLRKVLNYLICAASLVAWTYIYFEYGLDILADVPAIEKSNFAGDIAMLIYVTVIVLSHVLWLRKVL